MVNKSIDNIKRMTTQINDQPAKKDNILKLKITKKKTLDSATNTDVSFSPISVVLSSKRLIKDLNIFAISTTLAH